MTSPHGLSLKMLALTGRYLESQKLVQLNSRQCIEFQCFFIFECARDIEKFFERVIEYNCAQKHDEHFQHIIANEWPQHAHTARLLICADSLTQRVDVVLRNSALTQPSRKGESHASKRKPT
jgi:hypothetical protein